MRVAYFMLPKYSLIGARTCMHVYTNSAELDAQSGRGISKSSAEENIYANSVEKLDMRRSSG